MVLYGVSVVLIGGCLKWNLGDRKLAIIVFAKVRKLFGEGDLTKFETLRIREMCKPLPGRVLPS